MIAYVIATGVSGVITAVAKACGADSDTRQGIAGFAQLATGTALLMLDPIGAGAAMAHGLTRNLTANAAVSDQPELAKIGNMASNLIGGTVSGLTIGNETGMLSTHVDLFDDA